jgi:DNA-binding transcriptional ArsR family regulator
LALFKDAIYEQFSRIGKAVSSPKRLELLDLICQGEKTVETLSRETGLSVANTSQHLQTLKAAWLIKAEKKGLYVEYRLADEMVCWKGAAASSNGAVEIVAIPAAGLRSGRTGSVYIGSNRSNLP